MKKRPRSSKTRIKNPPLKKPPLKKHIKCNITKDVWHYIFRFLEIRDIFNVSITCKYLRNMRININKLVISTAMDYRAYTLLKPRIDNLECVKFLKMCFNKAIIYQISANRAKFVQCNGHLNMDWTAIKNVLFINSNHDIIIEDIDSIIDNVDTLSITYYVRFDTTRLIDIINSKIFNIDFSRKFAIKTWCYVMTPCTIVNIFKYEYNYNINLITTRVDFKKDHLIEYRFL